jgi:hypothetical protein
MSDVDDIIKSAEPIKQIPYSWDPHGYLPAHGFGW